MTAPEFRAHLEALKLNKSEAARLLGVQGSTIWRWHSGLRPIPKWVGHFLAYVEAHP